jgi:pSer/pThr/pTyr-binding forkhead associated (FHA) protein
MAKLILSMDGLVLKEIPLVKERTTIGRKPHNDIQIDNLAVSGEHAVIVTIMNDSFLEDLGSTNGTMVNGSSVKKHFLQGNDVIELGKYKLKYIAEAGQPVGASAADFEKTMVLRPSALKTATEQARAMAPAPATLSAESTNPQPKPAAAEAMRAVAAQHVASAAINAGTASKPEPVATASVPQAAKAAQPLGAIQILSGGNAGKELELIKPLTTLGKPGTQVAVLTRRPHGYYITHVEGAQHPTVNGQSIGSSPHALKDHDVVEIAGVKMEFFLKS